MFAAEFPSSKCTCYPQYLHHTSVLEAINRIGSQSVDRIQEAASVVLDESQETDEQCQVTFIVVDLKCRGRSGHSSHLLERVEQRIFSKAIALYETKSEIA